jgi:hypothetical protein
MFFTTPQKFIDLILRHLAYVICKLIISINDACFIFKKKFSGISVGKYETDILLVLQFGR